MLKLMFALGDVDTSLSGFIVDSRLLPWSYCPSLEEVKMGDIVKALSFPDRLWRFLVDPFGWRPGCYIMANLWRFFLSWGLLPQFWALWIPCKPKKSVWILSLFS